MLISDKNNAVVIENKIKSSINGINEWHDIHSNQVPSQLKKYYQFVTTDDEYCNKIVNRFIFSPNHNRIDFSKVENLHRKAFKRWLEDKLMDILISRIELLSASTEFGIRDQLSDFWQYVPHNILRSLQKNFTTMLLVKEILSQLKNVKTINSIKNFRRMGNVIFN